MTISEPTLLERMRARAWANNYWRLLGIEVDDCGEGWVRLRLPMRDELRNGMGTAMHGGALCSLLDAAVGAALATLHEGGTGGVNQVTLDLNISFISAVRSGDVLAEGRIIRKGASIVFGEADLRNESGDLLARGRATYMLLRQRG